MNWNKDTGYDVILTDTAKAHAQRIHFKHHRYFMLYKLIEKRAYVIGIYHDLQDYENFL